MNELEKRLEQKIDEAIKVQSKYTATYFDPSLGRLIRVLEFIRGRKYIKCTVCDADLTLTTCKHHEYKNNGKLPKNHDHEVHSLISDGYDKS